MYRTKCLKPEIKVLKFAGGLVGEGLQGGEGGIGLGGQHRGQQARPGQPQDLAPAG